MKAAIAWLVAAALAAGAARAEPSLTPAQVQGQALFDATCVYCHGEAGWGTRVLAQRLGPGRALLAKRDDLEGAYVRFVIRHGLGNMPAYTPTDLDAGQIDAVVAYLTRNRAEASGAGR